jgi:hypothetical protein
MAIRAYFKLYSQVVLRLLKVALWASFRATSPLALEAGA